MVARSYLSGNRVAILATDTPSCSSFPFTNSSGKQWHFPSRIPTRIPMRGHSVRRFTTGPGRNWDSCNLFAALLDQSLYSPVGARLFIEVPLWLNVPTVVQRCGRNGLSVPIARSTCGPSQDLLGTGRLAHHLPQCRHLLNQVYPQQPPPLLRRQRSRRPYPYPHCQQPRSMIGLPHR